MNLPFTLERSSVSSAPFPVTSPLEETSATLIEPTADFSEHSVILCLAHSTVSFQSAEAHGDPSTQTVSAVSGMELIRPPKFRSAYTT
jgi:hypothetical protein